MGDIPDYTSSLGVNTRTLTTTADIEPISLQHYLLFCYKVPALTSIPTSIAMEETRIPRQSRIHVQQIKHRLLRQTHLPGWIKQPPPSTGSVGGEAMSTLGGINPLPQRDGTHRRARPLPIHSTKNVLYISNGAHKRSGWRVNDFAVYDAFLP